MSTPSERLSHRQREQTPDEFAQFLIALAQSAVGSNDVAALWVRRDSIYKELLGPERCWDRLRDARTYAGPFPVICHPPCGPWGKFSWKCHQDPMDGIIAMQMVHRWGGVVEQPLGSRLFREHGDGRKVLRFKQSLFGFPAPKPTILYVVGKEELI